MVATINGSGSFDIKAALTNEIIGGRLDLRMQVSNTVEKVVPFFIRGETPRLHGRGRASAALQGVASTQHLIAFAAGSFGVWENASEFQDLQYSKTPSSESNGLELVIGKTV